MSYLVASQDANDGYLSDVPSQASFAQSEISNDLIVSTKALEKHFKDKYNALKQAYEQRIRQLSDVVHDTCSNLISDEILMEMRNDKTSSAYIPAHLSEIINSHLESERERYIHSMVTKVASQELELSKAADTNKALTQKIAHLEKDLVKGKQCEHALPPLQHKLNTLEQQYKDLISQTDAEISELKNKNAELREHLGRAESHLDSTTHQLKEKLVECESFRAVVEEKSREVQHLEMSFEQSNRELQVIEDLDKQEQKVKHELREQLASVTVQRNTLHSEVQLLQTKLALVIEDLRRSEEFQLTHANDESINKERISALMNQVETMLAQEASESNVAITTIHDKMKQFRQRMSQEIQREKRFSATLNEELLRLKSLHNDTVSENRRLVEEASHLRDKLKHEQSKSSQAALDLQEQAAIIAANKMRQFEADNQIKNLEQRIAQFDLLKRQEMSLLEEKIRLSADKENERDNLATEHKTAAYRLMYQNERDHLQNQLRHSYTFGSSGNDRNSSFLAASGLMDPTDLSTELSFKHAMESWTKEKSHLLQVHHEEVYVLKQQHEVTVKSLQQQLTEAVRNVDKMRGMLMENQSTMAHQVTNVEGLQHRYNTQHQVLELTQKELRLLQQQHQYLLNASLHQTERLNKSTASAAAGGVDASHHSRPRLSSADSGHSSYSLDNNSSTRHQQQQQQQSQHHASVADRSYVSSASQSKASGVAGFGSSASNNRLPVPQNIYNKMLQGSSPQAPQRSASPSVPRDTPSRTSSPAPAAASSTSVLTQQQLQAAQNEIHKLQHDLREAESRLASEKSRTTVLKSTLQSQFEELLNNYRHLQTQFESNVSSSAATAAALRAELDRERSLRVEASSRASAAMAAAANSQAGLSSVSRLEEDSVFDLTTVTPHPLQHGSEVPTYNQQQQQQQGSYQQHEETHFDHSHQMENSNGQHQQYQNNNTTYLSIETATKHLEESLQHQMELTHIATEELSLERERTLNTKRRESKLYQLLIEVDNRYKTVIQELRTELRAIRNSVLDVSPFLTIETSKTLANLQIQLDIIFKYNTTVHESETKAMRISLANAHEKEMRLLEERFVAQVGALNKNHATELERMHAEIMGKAEKVVNGLNLDNVTLTRIQSSGNIKVGGPHIALPAFESVMKGLMEALESSDVMDGASANQIISLASAHHEPSFAASAAAKSLLIGHIDHFVGEIQHKAVAITSSASLASLDRNSLAYSRNSHVEHEHSVHSSSGGMNASFVSAQNRSFTSQSSGVLPKY